MSEPTKAEEALAQIEERLVDAEIRMEKSVEALHKELSGIRTGRASPSLVERLQVEAYGVPTPLQSLAGISTPEARLLVIRPYDRSAIPAIEKAIQRSDLSLTPSNDGQVIRIVIPQLTEERRHELSKLCARRAEEARVAVRNIRRDEVEHLRKVEKEGHVGRDDVERSLAQVQQITDQFIAKVDEVARRKEAEILEV
ncbi:MAG: ribosome recycling factor [Candidatus Dormibacteria bacterium]|jgi:ribosome recycling factor|nr:ribosome recycling factor [Chloroflexota bacterium]HBV94040.1 ribosome recycling factor [Chloroflexota bacterium]